MQFIMEFFKPSLKCERLGHKDKSKSMVIRESYRGPLPYVCFDSYVRLEVCQRCGHQGDLTRCTIKDRYSGVTMPSSDWDEMRKNGYLIVGGEWV